MCVAGGTPGGGGGGGKRSGWRGCEASSPLVLKPGGKDNWVEAAASRHVIRSRTRRILPVSNSFGTFLDKHWLTTGQEDACCYHTVCTSTDAQALTRMCLANTSCARSTSTYMQPRPRSRQHTIPQRPHMATKICSRQCIRQATHS